jgi:chlorobactene glucosyltransferase
MGSDFWLQRQEDIALFVVALMIIALSNLLTLRRLGRYPLPSSFPSVSILVPARNEEGNIIPCLQALLAQRYSDYEVIVLDDDSIDGTARELALLKAQEKRLIVIQGKPLPQGWIGKQWACHQLAHAAQGELLLFTDADTRHDPETLAQAVAALQAEKTDLLTAFVSTETKTWSERLSLPILNWSILSFLPLWLAHHLRVPAFSAANGKFMLFRKKAYERIGGHQSIRANAVDDLALVRKIITHKFRWRLLDGQSYIRCRMYRNWREVFEGLGKNLFPAFGYNVPLFLFIWIWLALVFLEPLFLIGLSFARIGLPSSFIGLALAAIAVSIILWTITVAYFRFPLYLSMLYPLIIIIALLIASHSLSITLRGRARWKGRTLIR